MSGSLDVWKDELRSKSKSTQDQYLRGFEWFREYTGLTPDEIFEIHHESLRSPDPRDRNKVSRLVKACMADLKDEGYSFSTVYMVYKAVKSFMTSQGLEFSLHGAKPRLFYEGQRIIEKSEIRDLLKATANLRNKAIIYTLKDPGLRVSDPVELNYGHVRGALESDSEFVLIRLRQKKNDIEAIEEFEVEIDNIKGGREYLIKIILEDVEGNVKTEEMNLPYIREFENFGKQLFDKGIVIGVSYYEYYPDPCPWEELGETIVHPLLGGYNVRDPVVIAKHIDWATGHGINCFFLPWGWDDDYSHNVYHESLVNLVSSPMIDQLHLAVQYEFSRLWYHGVEVDWEEGDLYLNDPEKWKGVIEDFIVLNTNFFQKDNFLTIGGKPVVYWYGGSAIHGRLEEFLDEVKSTCENGIFIFSDHAKVNVINEDYFVGLADEKFFDGWTSWAATWHVPVEEPLNENFPVVLEEGYKFWMEVAEIHDKVLMPSIIPGFVELRDPSWFEFATNLPRDTGMFSKELEVASKYATQIEGKKIIKIDSWNDFGEGHALEPTVEEGFAFLEAQRDTLTEVSRET